MAGDVPTHDDNGKQRPGAVSLTDDITVDSISASMESWRDSLSLDKNRNMFSSQQPNIDEPYSNLETLINEALKLYGNLYIDSIDPGVKSMLIGRANRIVEDMRAHPYFPISDIDYYKSLTDKRKIPDEIMISGLLYHYSRFMKSVDWKELEREYYVTASQILYNRMFGKGRPQLQAVDK